MPRNIEMKITHLEMLQRPLIHSTQPRGKLALIRAEMPTVHFYYYLHNTIGRDHYWVNRYVMDEEKLTNIIHDERVHILVLYVNGVPAGFAELDLRTSDIADIAFFGLMRDFRHQGYGRFLLNSVLETAWMHHPQKVTIQTSSLDHPRAVRLYQQNGFVPVGQSTTMLSVPDNF